MRIWMLNHYANLPSEGAGTRHFDLGCQLQRRGHQVHIFAASYDHFGHVDRIGETDRSRTDEFDGLRLTWVKTSSYTGNGWGRIKNMLQFSVRVVSVARGLVARRKEERPEVIMGSSFHPFTCLAALILAWQLGARFVFEIRDLWPQSLVDLGKASNWHPAVIALRGLERFLLRHADTVIVLMPGAKAYVEQRGVNPSRIHHVPNGTDLERWDVANDEKVPSALKELRRSTALLAMYTGSHAESDCLEPILLSADRLRDAPIHFVFIGDGPDKPRLEARKEALGLANVTFLPRVPKTAMPAVLNLADVCLVSLQNAPLYKYGLSFNKIWDYMASRRAILMMGDANENPVRLAQCGEVVSCGNAIELEGALLRLLAMPEEERWRLGTNGRTYLEASHSTAQLAVRLENALGG